MTKRPNLQPTDKVVATLPLAAIRQLRVLARNSGQGANEADVAGSIIKQYIDRLIAKGVLSSEPPPWTVYPDDPVPPELQ